MNLLVRPCAKLVRGSRIMSIACAKLLREGAFWGVLRAKTCEYINISHHEEIRVQGQYPVEIEGSESEQATDIRHLLSQRAFDHFCLTIDALHCKPALRIGSAHDFHSGNPLRRLAFMSRLIFLQTI